VGAGGSARACRTASSTRKRCVSTALIFLVSFLTLSPVSAKDQLVKIDTRPGVTVSFYYMKRPGAAATVVLLTGGGGGIGMKDGAPTSTNFLIRSRDVFAANGFNVAAVGKPTDKPDLDYAFRISPRHMEDLRKVVDYLKQDAGLPVWLVGTSMGTISTAAAAIAFGDEQLAGIVLTSSITRFDKVGAVPTQKLERIHIPVLVMHHEKDACPACRPHEVPYIMKGLTNAPIKKQLMVNGGAGAQGDPCEALHWHGYIGMEKEAVDLISAWIKKPQA
jgi:pimeloyl-ACP methyl ester carboxylesterase